MKPEIKPLGLTERRIEGKHVLHQIRMAKRLIEVPEYFYQQPTPKQEEMCKEDYEALWQRLSEEDNVHVPKTIETYFGKVEFIQDELHFRDFCNIKYLPSDQKYQDFQDHLVKYKALHKARKKTFKKLDSLSPKEVEQLKAKAANTPLQIIDFPTGNLVRFPSR
jgi:hypothetical protein